MKKERHITVAERGGLTMAEALIFLLVCILVLTTCLVIEGGRISKLEGIVESLLIYFKITEGNNDKKK
jgi:hypothetical protein